MNLIITETTRDAWQGLQQYIPAQTKADYICSLLKAGFDIIDVGSFVAEKAIPQLKDTAEVLSKLDLSGTQTKIMVLAANEKGMDAATDNHAVTWLAFPYSISPTFLKLNINADLQQGQKLIDLALNLCEQRNKKLKVYLTMAFGNPYKDTYSPEIVYESVANLYAMGVRYITLGDTTGTAIPPLIMKIFNKIILKYPKVEFGLHLHTTSNTYYDKLESAFLAGCRSYDAVINGLGGCPMTGYELLGNLNTFELLYYCSKNKIDTKINSKALSEVIKKNKEVFNINTQTH
jgi:hydroxymethylglutaryl-CoA lyase